MNRDSVPVKGMESLREGMESRPVNPENQEIYPLMMKNYWK